MTTTSGRVSDSEVIWTIRNVPRHFAADRAAINRAVKILTQYERLVQKFGIRLSAKRIEELNRLRDAGRISTSDLPAHLLRFFPTELSGLSLEDIRALRP